VYSSVRVLLPCRKVAPLNIRLCRWIRIDQKQLHAQTQGKVWTLTADDLSLKEDCLDNLGLPVAVRSGTIKKFTLVRFWICATKHSYV
jgi:hypothetical protein